MKRWYINNGAFSSQEYPDSTVFEVDDAATEIVIPEGVREIGWHAFEGCAGLINIIIPHGVTEICGQAFMACTNLTEIVIPEGVTTIEWKAFAFCCNLTSVTLPGSVTFIRNDAFQFTNIRHLYIPIWRNTGYAQWPEDMLIHTDDPMAVPVKRRVWAAVAFCEDGRSFGDEVGRAYAKYLKANAGKIIPAAMAHPALMQSLLREKLITAKDIDAYHAAAREKGDTELTAQLLAYQTDVLTTAQVVKTRAKKAADLEEEQEQVVDRAVARADKKDLSGLVFAVTGELTSFPMRKNLKELLERYGAKLASSVTAKTDYLVDTGDSADPEMHQRAVALGVDVIDEKRLNELLYLRFTDAVEVDIPFWVGEVNPGAFQGCTTLKRVTLSEGVTRIGSTAFQGCTGLTEIVIPQSVTGPFRFTFEGCSALTCVNLPKGVSAIGMSTFEDCTALTDIHIPEGCRSIGLRAFHGCASLHSVTIAQGMETIDNLAFGHCPSLKHITLPASVREIAANAFVGRKGLTIHAPVGSYAAAFARKRKIPFESV